MTPHPKTVPPPNREEAIFPTAEDFNRAAEDYFNNCDGRGVVYGEAGLCLALSRSNPQKRAVTLQRLRGWYDGKDCPWLQEAVQLAYLRIQDQIESDPRYQEKSGMITRGSYLQKQPRLGGYQEKQEGKGDTIVQILCGPSMDESDFQ